MIIWLASYPKSGNTWLRTIISQLLYKNLNDEEVLEESRKIRLYPSKIDFLDLDEDFKLPVFPDKKKKLILDKTVINWEASQSKLNLDKKLRILKTHNMLCRLKIKNDFYTFTNLENTLGVIHIVRDPRNIFTSLINHFSFTSDEKALDFIFNENQTIGIEENTIPQLLSSWNNHYNSWKRFPKNNILIKYENLILDPKKEIVKLIQYLKKFFELSYSDSELDQILYNSSFENLKNLEKKGLFKENALNKNNVPKKFFYLGKKNDWKKLLDKKVSESLEKNFNKEMLELGYL